MNNGIRFLLVVVCAYSCRLHAEAPGKLALSPPPPGTHFVFGGVVGERIKADIENWILPAPVANPGMLEMFHVRDRKPVPELVPWAGEFVGKYLIGAIQALRMSDSPQLRAMVEDVIRQTIAGQDDDGYLGPFRRDERLLGQWDLWGHYHIIQAMLMWHEETGDQAALDCAKKMGDLICKIYLNTERRPIQAGSTEMNLAIIHGLGKLYRATNDQKYLDMVRVVEEDWKKAGDYFRQGLANVPFYKIPSPRWESLHDMQGLGELYRITGNEEYKTAYVNLWKSIRAYDRHNTGGFTTGEQAIGNPYTPGAIETCCTTAWSAISLDVLGLTGGFEVVDELELAFYNSILGSQHPSGRWFTYNTPMDGKREASAHTIVFQSRAGTPELNCCSVNAPRGLGMLSEWAVTGDGKEGFIVNYLGPMLVTIPRPDGHTATIEVKSDYPASGKIFVQAKQDGGMGTPILIRFPQWAPEIILNNAHYSPAKTPFTTISLGAGATESYTEFEIPMPIRTWVGDGAQRGKTSLYRGPVLLTFDQRDNTFDAADFHALDFKNLGSAEAQGLSKQFAPLIALSFKAADGTPVVLRDFATAGATGTEYLSWLPVENAPPPNFVLESPARGAKIPAGPQRFTWQGTELSEGWSYTLELASDAEFKQLVLVSGSTRHPWQVVRAPLQEGVPYFWRVRAINAAGETLSSTKAVRDVLNSFRGKDDASTGPDSFLVDASLRNDFIDNAATYEYREDGLVVGDHLDGKAAPEYGYVDLAEGLSPTPDRHGKDGGAVKFDGKGQIRYRTPGFPVDNFTLSVWFKIEAEQQHLAQVFSAWSKGGDDPLRIVIDKGSVFARIEGGAGANSKGAPVKLGKWTHIAAVKNGGNLKFYVDGALVDSVAAPTTLPTLSRDVSLGSNPHHSGDEHLVGAVDDFRLIARPFDEALVQDIASGKL